MENTNITDNTRQAGHSADSTINAGTDIKSSTTNTSQHTIDDINSGQQPLEAESTLDYQICMRKMSTILSLNLL